MNDRIITRRDIIRQERHATKQALSAAVRAVGGGDVDLWADDAEGQPEAVTRENRGASE